MFSDRNQQDAVNNTLSHINSGTRPTGPVGTRWGVPFRNDRRDLPSHDALGRPVDYSEYRVDSTPFGETGAGSRRVVVGSDGSRYFTGSHYGDNPGKPFVRIK